MSIPKDQTAAVISAKDAPIVLQRRAVPTPGDNQLLVKLEASAINPVDYKMQEGYFSPSYPLMVGTDCAGTVVAVGKDVRNHTVGDKVFYQSEIFLDDHSAFQEYNLVPADIAAKIPSNISIEQAATIPVAGACAFVGLFEDAKIPFPANGPTATGKTLLVIGGSSSVGQYTIQLARIAGFATIITTASSAHASFLKSLGATHVLERNAPDVVSQINAVLSSDGVAPLSVLYDAIALPASNDMILDILKANPRLTGDTTSVVLVLDPSDKLVSGNPSREPPIKITRINGFSHIYRDVSVPFWKNVGKWLEEGKFVPNRVEIVDGGLKGLQTALDKNKAGVSGVKLVIKNREGL